MDPSNASESAGGSSQHEKASPRRVSPIFLVVLVLTILLVTWFVARNRSRQAELQASSEIKSLGGLTVAAANRKFTASLNLATVKDPGDFDRILGLTGKLYHLNILDLAKSAVTSQQVAELSGLTRLTSLQLSQTSITDDDLRHLRGMKQLEALYVANTALTDQGLPAIGKLKNLTILDISGNALDGDLAALQSLTQLTWLLIKSDHPLSSDAVTSLASMPSLRRLTVLPDQLLPEDRARLLVAKPDLAIE